MSELTDKCVIELRSCGKAHIADHMEQLAAYGPVSVALQAEMDTLQQRVEADLDRAFQLGQTYWCQADGESYSQNRKSDETLAKFRALKEAALEGSE